MSLRPQRVFLLLPALFLLNPFASLVVSSLLVKNETAVSFGSTIHLPCAVALPGDVDDDDVDIGWQKRNVQIWEGRNYLPSETWDRYFTLTRLCDVHVL